MRTLGVIGTMVWDTIWRDGDVGSPVEEWGGISYALAAADATGSGATRVRPIIKLGRDLAEPAFHFLRDLSIIETDEAIRVVDEPNPRVELHYRGMERRAERLRGGVSPWRWSELASRIEGCHALYLNFITGNELRLEDAQRLRMLFHGPIYVDLHSLLLTTGPGGRRERRSLARWSEWLACFDAVQMNEDELRALASHWGDPWAFAADVVGRETRLLFVTLGTGGAAYVMTSDALPLGTARRGGLVRRGTVQTGRVPAERVTSGDPTGCGDVWGMTACLSLLEGGPVEAAMRSANAAACRNVGHRGASGLNRFLRGELEHGG